MANKIYVYEKDSAADTEQVAQEYLRRFCPMKESEAKQAKIDAANSIIECITDGMKARQGSRCRNVFPNAQGFELADVGDQWVIDVLKKAINDLKSGN